MKFDFTPTGDAKACMTKTDIAKFFKATRKDVQSTPNKRWVKDVIVLFASRLDITFGQAVQLVKTGEFDRCQQIHTRMLQKIPLQVMGILEDGRPGMVSNPFHAKIRGYTDMTRENHVDMVKAHFVWAISLRHPDDKVPAGFPKRDEETIARKIISRMHFDETRRAHQQRTVEALRAFFNGDSNAVGDLMMERIREQFPADA